MVPSVGQQLRLIQRNTIRIKEVTNKFIAWDQYELNLRFFRVHRRVFKKKCLMRNQPGTATEQLKISKFNILMDVAVELMDQLFSTNMNLGTDQSLLDTKISTS